MQKTLLYQMEKLLSKTEEREKIQVEQEQVRKKDKTKETQENVKLTRPAKNLDLDAAVALVDNVTNDASPLQAIMEETNNRFEKLISGLANTFVPAASSHAESCLKARPPKFGDGPENVNVEAWVAKMKMYFESQQGGSEKSIVLVLLSFLPGASAVQKQAQAWIMQKTELGTDSCKKIFDMLLRRYGDGPSSSAARLQFDVRKQSQGETIDTY